MKLTIISSSQRKESESLRTATFISETAQSIFTEVSAIDLVDIDLPFFDDDDENTVVAELWKPLSDTLQNSDAFVFVTPEWKGMASPMLKNFMMYCSDELAHKPAAIVSVTSSLTNGAYPIAELRASSYKNNSVIYIPNHVIVRNVGVCFKTAELDETNIHDKVARTRIQNALGILNAYAKVLGVMRQDTTVEWTKFPFGM